ncbi:MAG TPA: hypothetical protein PKH97_06670 [Tetrasphaera sp.]|uniref:hypothetical protein n=1 Tax=Nostocoides sp. TaxID=1917966 RepID=UPI002B6BE8EE|nr:hypothetical protein [Tetrasphaera sp.]HNQ06854.1 hypothetical protein [Tetrasphaera sp.]
MIAEFVLAGGEADGSSASSGFLGFVVFFALALAVWFLVRNMTGRLRRMNYAETQRTQDAPAEPDDATAAEADERAGAAPGAKPDPDQAPPEAP